MKPLTEAQARRLASALREMGYDVEVVQSGRHWGALVWAMKPGTDVPI